MTLRLKTRILIPGTVALVLCLILQTAYGHAFRNKIGTHRFKQRLNRIGDETGLDGPASLPSDIRIFRDISYGRDPLQRFDVYAPMETKNAPVIFMVHGGAWIIGDKSSKTVIQNKVKRWVPKGFIVISTNYRMAPKILALEQAKDVAQAIAFAQSLAYSWGGDRNKFILMGHSAGAHLVALLTASRIDSFGSGLTPWLGTVVLDCPALDVVETMTEKHALFYDLAFSVFPSYWKLASPFHVLGKGASPILVVCSPMTGNSCPQAQRFVQKAVSLGIRATALRQNMPHNAIDDLLGQEPKYTEAVESFLSSLDTKVAKALTTPSG